MKIIPLPHNPVPVYYPGGEQIRAYRGVRGDVDGISPEDWLGSTTVLRSPVEGEDLEEGHSSLEDGRTVLDLLNDDPESWVGPTKPATVDFLVKLIDPAERVPVHWHPNARFAREHLSLGHGKAEAWVVLSRKARVWLGLRQDVDLDEFHAAIAHQRVAWMLDQMHVFDLAAGDTVYVPPGMLHAIDSGSLMVEVQEPTSVSILAEYERLGIGELNASLGAGWSAALKCLSPPTERHIVEDLLGRLPDTTGIAPLFPEESRQFFRAWVLNLDGEASLTVDGISVVLVDEGEVKWTASPDVPETVARRGSAWLFGISSRSLEIRGRGRLLVFSGPASDKEKEKL